MEEQNTQIQESQNQPKKPTNFLLIGGVILALVVLGGGILLRGSNQPKPSTLTAQTENKEVVDQTSEFTIGENLSDSQSSEPKVIEVETGSFYYNPSEIRIKVGEAVRIELTAKDLMHDFNIDELGVDGPIVKAGETTTIDFIPQKAGKYEYYCSVGQHRVNGQVGTLIVEE